MVRVSRFGLHASGFVFCSVDFGRGTLNFAF